MGTELPVSRKFNYLDITAEEEKQKAIDDWLPVTSSRNAKWYYSAFHNITAIIGAGVLGLPFAMSELGWGPGVIALTLSWVITFYTLWQMVEMHEIEGRRFDRYHELGQYAFGEKLGLFIVVPQQLTVEVAVNIVYMVTGGQSLKRFHDIIVYNGECKDKNKDKEMKLYFFIMIFASSHFVLSHLPSLNSISAISCAAAVMSISYSTISWIATLVSKGAEEHIDCDHRYPERRPKTVFSFFHGLGTMAFAYAAHNVVLEIQATIPSTQDRPAKGPMWRGVKVAYIAVALCYFPVAIIGYSVFGKNVNSNILFSINKPHWLIAMLNLFVVIHLIGSYQVYAMPVFDMIETLLVRKLNFQPHRILRFIVRNLYVAFTMFMAITFPFFDGLLGFFGGFVLAPTTYLLPCIIWLKIYKPKRFSTSWWCNWSCIVLTVCLMLVAPIGGMWSIVDHAKDYKFYSGDDTQT